MIVLCPIATYDTAHKQIATHEKAESNTNSLTARTPGT